MLTCTGGQISLQTIVDYINANPEKGGIGYSAALAYVSGDMVVEGTDVYISTAAQTGLLPSTNPGTWAPIATIEQGGILWETAKVYIIGDIISESNKVYCCITAHTSGVWLTDAANWTTDILPDAGVI